MGTGERGEGLRLGMEAGLRGGDSVVALLGDEVAAMARRK